jgi:hypothetical protein
MKKFITLFYFACFISCLHLNAQNTIRFFDDEMFYRGYSTLSAWAADTTITKPAGADVIRLKTSLITKKLTDSTLNLIGDKLTLKVLLKAACDNYDRGAHVNLVMAKKGDTTYSTPGATTSVKRIELARFITPFMNKNKMPDTVPYVFEVNNIAMILKEKSIRDSFDLWIELEIFGVPDAAWNEISGCKGPLRYDVFYGTLDLITSGTTAIETNNILIPITNQFSLNMKKANQSDTIGVPAKTFKFTLPTKSYYTRAFIITSSHGAGSGGEEYNRRNHYVYVDGNLALEYLPGFETCEPYRKFNTQGNGIYGSSVKSDAQWQSFSNWCPGAYVPTRIMYLGTLNSGVHTIKLDLPDALFPNNDDKIQTSIYVLGKNEPFTSVSEVDTQLSTAVLYPNPASEMVSILTDAGIKQFTVFNVLGKNILQGISPNINISHLDNGLYYISVNFENGQYTIKPFIKK